MSRHVWILNHYAQEPNSAGGTRHYHLAQHLPIYDWTASIIRASVEHKTGKQTLAKNERQKLDYINQIPFLSVWTPSYQGNNKGRIINMLTYSYRTLIPQTLQTLTKPDAIIGSSVHPFAALSGAILAKRYNVPFLFEVRDLWPQTLIDMKYLKKNSLQAYGLRALEKCLYQRAKRIIILLPKAGDYIESLGIPLKKVIYIPNGVEIGLFPNYPSQYSTTSTFTLMYFGAHGEANGLDNILYAMSIIQKNKISNINLRLIGEGPLKKTLKNLAGELHINNVTFEDAVPKKDIPKLANEADGFVIAVNNLPQLYRYGISMNKIFDYLAASKPTIIASNAANNPIANANAGITVPPDDPNALAQAIIKLANTPFEERQRMGELGRAYVEKHHSFEKLAETLVQALNESMMDFKKS